MLGDTGTGDQDVIQVHEGEGKAGEQEVHDPLKGHAWLGQVGQEEQENRTRWTRQTRSTDIMKKKKPFIGNDLQKSTSL